MNILTFQDTVKSRKDALAHDLDNGEEEDEQVRVLEDVDGEEEQGDDRVSPSPSASASDL